MFSLLGLRVPLASYANAILRVLASTRRAVHEGSMSYDQQMTRRWRCRPTQVDDQAEGSQDPFLLKQQEQAGKLRPWRPVKRLRRSEMERMRSLRKEEPHVYTPSRLAKTFGVSLEAASRILHSRWMPTREQSERQERARRNAWASIHAKGGDPSPPSFGPKRSSDPHTTAGDSSP